MSFHERSLDEREAASIVAGLHSNTGASLGAVSASGRKKRSRADDTDVNENDAKKPAVAAAASAALSLLQTVQTATKKDPPMDATGLVFAQPELKPAPYFYYSDHSTEMDDDPLTPITTAGNVPTFPAKMHAILTNPDLADVVGWAPHGRSWRILKPRDFEIRVLPKYFEHSKFSSFVRQANGWGFRRMSQGYDKNAYYHEYFLRAMPWLCKKMRRPKVAEKKAVNPGMEPDLDAISFEHPVPDRPPTREVLVLRKTIELGPKARMPVLWDTGTPPAAPSSPVAVPDAPSAESLSEVENLPSLSHSASYGDLKPAAVPDPPVVAAPAPREVGAVAANTMLSMGENVQNNLQQFPENTMLPQNSMPTQTHIQPNMNSFNSDAPVATVPANNPTPISLSSESHPTQTHIQTNINPVTNYAAAAQRNNPTPSSLASDSHFAAGFMAATAYHSNQIQNMLSSAFMSGMPIPANGNMVMPSAAPAANYGNALDLLQMAGMVQNHLRPQVPQGNPGVSAAAAASSVPPAGLNPGFNGSSQNALTVQAMQRLQQFQAYQAHFR